MTEFENKLLEKLSEIGFALTDISVQIEKTRLAEIPATSKKDHMAHGKAQSLVGLRQAREARGWTKTELARLAQCHPADIGKIENGHLVPYAPMLRRLVEAIGVSEAELYGVKSCDQ